MRLLEIDSDGDPGIKAGAMKAIADRRNWPIGTKRQVASRYQLRFEVFDRIIEFVEKAVARRRT
jgi:sigma54-dependent transcription regulator